MPPKKKVTEDGADTGGDGKFRWTPENERTLLLLAMNRGTLTKDDYHKMVGAFPGPAGTNWDAIRQRFIKMRKEQRALCEELGWNLPAGGSVANTPSKTSAKSPKKRAVSGEKGDEAGEAEVELESPTKKPRARKPKEEVVKKEVVKKEVEEDDGLGDIESDEDLSSYLPKGFRV